MISAHRATRLRCRVHGWPGQARPWRL